MRMSGFSWAALNFLWLVPVVIGVVFVAAVLIYAVWRTYQPGRSVAARRDWDGPVESGYAGSKPHAGSDPSRTTNPPAPRRRVP
jgi:hypothetical protein